MVRDWRLKKSKEIVRETRAETVSADVLARIAALEAQMMDVMKALQVVLQATEDVKATLDVVTSLKIFDKDAILSGLQRRAG